MSGPAGWPHTPAAESGNSGFFARRLNRLGLNMGAPRYIPGKTASRVLAPVFLAAAVVAGGIAAALGGRVALARR